MIPYINQGTTSIGFCWTEFVTIVWNTYIVGSLFLITLDSETVTISKSVFVD